MRLYSRPISSGFILQYQDYSNGICTEKLRLRDTLILDSMRTNTLFYDVSNVLDSIGILDKQAVGRRGLLCSCYTGTRYLCRGTSKSCSQQAETQADTKLILRLTVCVTKFSMIKPELLGQLENVIPMTVVIEQKQYLPVTTFLPAPKNHKD